MLSLSFSPLFLCLSLSAEARVAGLTPPGRHLVRGAAVERHTKPALMNKYGTPSTWETSVSTYGLVLLLVQWLCSGRWHKAFCPERVRAFLGGLVAMFLGTQDVGMPVSADPGANVVPGQLPEGERCPRNGRGARHVPLGSVGGADGPERWVSAPDQMGLRARHGSALLGPTLLLLLEEAVVVALWATVPLLRLGH